MKDKHMKFSEFRVRVTLEVLATSRVSYADMSSENARRMMTYAFQSTVGPKDTAYQIIDDIAEGGFYRADYCTQTAKIHLADDDDWEKYR